MFTDPLFADELQLQWLPDELFFSLVSRYHHLSHNHKASTTCQQLFGSPQQGCAHDFPSRIDAFTERTNGALGNSETVIRRHTILSFYLAFQTPSASAAAIEAMRGPNIGSLKFKLGLLTSRFRANHPLKACLQCMQEDRLTADVAYWHRQHQLPGVWICLQHNEPLVESTLKSTGVGRFSWCLPQETYLRPAWLTIHPSGTARLNTLRLFAEASTAIADLPQDTHLDQDRLVASYRSELKAKGLMRGDPGRLALSELAESYLSFVSPVTCVPELSSLPRSKEEAVSQVPRLVRLERKTTHPLRHLTLMTWIFGNWAAAWEGYVSLPALQQSADSRTGLAGSHAALEPSHEKKQFLAMLSVGSHTVSGAARLLGIDPTTGMAWAASAGYTTKRRAKILKPEMLKQVIEMLEFGKDVHEISEVLPISVVTVRKVMRTEVGLYGLWHQRRHEQAQEHARTKWAIAVNANPLCGVKAVRLLEPAAFSWLYRNDHQWLNLQIADLVRIEKSNHARTNWDSRDTALAASIRKTILELSVERPGEVVSLWRIYQRLPELKSKLAKLDRLPLSEKALEIGKRQSTR